MSINTTKHGITCNNLISNIEDYHKTEGMSILFFYASVNLLCYLSIHPSSIHPTIYLSIYLSVCLSVCISIYHLIASCPRNIFFSLLIQFGCVFIFNPFLHPYSFDWIMFFLYFYPLYLQHLYLWHVHYSYFIVDNCKYYVEGL